MYFSYVLIGFAAGSAALPCPDAAPASTTSSAVNATTTAGTEGYTYNRLPAGITRVSGGQTVDFLQNNTGAPTLQAPQPDDQVPDDAAIYQPSAPIMNMTDFRIWHDQIRDDNKGGSKRWIKVAPDTYEFSKGTGFPLDWNNNMAFNGFSGWTLDLRGCTFTETRIDGDKNYSDQMLYINNSDDFTILGGTFWMNQGVEMFTQGKVISMTGDGEGTAIIQVDVGYDYDVWGEQHDPGSFNCIDTSNPDHYYHPDYNFWYQSNMKLLGNNKVQADYTSRSGVKVGQYLTIKSGPSSAASASMECNGGVHFKGMTSNAVFFNYGIGPTCTRRPLILEDCLITNLPAFKGQAPRVNGPTMSYGNYGSAIFQAEGMPDIDFRNSWWQYTGEPNDLTSLENYKPPREFTTPL
ncbi:MAG: hypothetical protein Q9222_003010 [Ikaeria aurantiellina]